MHTPRTLESLHKLIHQLPPDSKAALIKKIKALPPKSKKSDYIRLFQAIQDSGPYDETKIKRVWNNNYNPKRNDRYFYEAQYDLLRYLLNNTTVDYTKGNKNSIEERHRIAEQLVKLDLPDLAFEYYNNLTEDYRSLGYIHLAVSIIYKQLTLVPLMDKHATAAAAEQLLSKLNVYDAECRAYVAAYNAHYFFSNLYLNKPWPRTKTELQRTIELTQEKLSLIPANTDIGLMTNLFILKCHVWQARLAFDYVTAAEFQLQITEHIREHYDLLIIERPSLIYSEYLEMADLCHRLFQFKAANQFREIAAQAINHNTDHRVSRHPAVMHSLLMQEIRRNNSSTVYELTENLDSYVRNHWAGMNPANRNIICGTILKSYLYLGENETFEATFNHFVASGLSELPRADHWMLICLMRCCNAYDGLIKMHNNVYYDDMSFFTVTCFYFGDYLSRKSKERPFEHLIWKSFMTLSNTNKISEHDPIIKSLLNKITALNNSDLHYHQYFLEVFDVRVWLENKLQQLEY